MQLFKAHTSSMQADACIIVIIIETRKKYAEYGYIIVARTVAQLNYST